MAVKSLPSRPRIISANAHKYTGKQVSVLGEVINITTGANTITLRMPDDETIIVLLPTTNSSTVEPHLLTEVAGKLVSRGQVEASFIRQFTAKQSALFNKQNYVDVITTQDAFINEYDV